MDLLGHKPVGSVQPLLRSGGEELEIGCDFAVAVQEGEGFALGAGAPRWLSRLGWVVVFEAVVPPIEGPPYPGKAPRLDIAEGEDQVGHALESFASLPPQDCQGEIVVGVKGRLALLG